MLPSCDILEGNLKLSFSASIWASDWSHIKGTKCLIEPHTLLARFPRKMNHEPKMFRNWATSIPLLPLLLSLDQYDYGEGAPLAENASSFIVIWAQRSHWQGTSQLFPALTPFSPFRTRTSIPALRPRYDFARNRAPSSISAMPRESEDVKLGVGIGWTLKGWHFRASILLKGMILHVPFSSQ